MIELSVSGIVKSFEQDKRILDGISFQVDTGERVAILGKNGAGKTTLFRILTKELLPDEGTVELAPGRRIGLISQIPVYPDGYSVEDVLASAFDRIRAIGKQMERLAEKMGGGADRELLRKYDELAAAFEAGGGYRMEVETNKVANGLNISREMRNRPFSALSGGEQTRVNLARLILEDTDILLLDEPTNHLDMEAMEWLEEYLAGFPGTVLAISHDRYFLDRSMKRVIEIKEGKADFYSGSYSFYVREKEARYELQRKTYEKEQAKIKQLSAAAERMHGWGLGNSKLQKRALAMDRRIERMKTTDRPVKESKLKLRFGEEDFWGDEVLSVKRLSKAFGERGLFRDVELEVKGGERIALIGPNGAGKTTLLRILLGEETVDEGKIRFGPTVKAGYLPQQVKFSHPERNLVDTMLYEADCTVQQARDRLGAFRFRGEDVLKQVSQLSGGERSRLRLCMLMNEKINLLVLDEPTNHLDLDSREWIEEAVEDFEGTMIFVSHDRYFINRFATRIWELRDGTLFDFQGGFEAYRLSGGNRPQNASASKREKAAARKENRPRKDGKNAGRQLAALEREIAKREAELEQLDRELEEAACDYIRLGELFPKREALQGELDELYRQWEALAEEEAL